MAKKKTKKPSHLPKVFRQPGIVDVMAKLDRIEQLVQKQEQDESLVAAEESKELSEIDKLEQLEEDIKKDVAPHPLARITYHDITKGLIGAFFGVVGHFAFFEGKHIADSLSIGRATTLLAVSLVLLVLFLYFSGFRRIKEYNRYLPIRVAIIFLTAIVVSIIVLFLFNVLPFPVGWDELYVNIASVSILAVMGAATADLIGGEA